MEKKAMRRKRFTYEVDFDDFKMPFNKNIQKKSVEFELTDWTRPRLQEKSQC